MAADNYSGVNSLARILTERMRSMTDKPLVLDYATVNDDMSITTDTYPVAIKPEYYSVCRQLTLGNTDDEFAETKPAADYLTHTHKVKLPRNMRKLKPKDRVLVAWVGDDLCVIDIILQGPEP